MDNGWVKLYRKILKWEWYKNSEMVHLFIHLILNANHKSKLWQGIKIERGQLITGRKNLSFETGISEQTIRTCLKKMESTNEIIIKSTNKYSIITICNFEYYNDLTQQTNQQLTNNQPTNNQQLTTTNNVKNYNNDNNNISDLKKSDKNIYQKKMIEIWENEYRKVKSIDYIFNNKDFLKLKSLKNKIEKSFKLKNIEINEERFFKSFCKLIESSKNDKFILENFNLSIIESNYNKLISKNIDLKIDKKWIKWNLIYDIDYYTPIEFWSKYSVLPNIENFKEIILKNEPPLEKIKK